MSVCATTQIEQRRCDSVTRSDVGSDSLLSRFCSWLCFRCCSDTCSSCSHVIAEHYHSFRIVRASLEEDECSITVAAAAPAAASSSSSSLSLQDEAAAPAPVAAAVRVTHDYLMECVLCGKGTDEQRFDAGGAPVAAKEVGASSSSSAAAPAAGAAPSFSLSSIQLNAMIRGSCAPGSSPMPAGAAAEAASAASAQATVVDDEWA